MNFEIADYLIAYKEEISQQNEKEGKFTWIHPTGKRDLSFRIAKTSSSFVA